MAIKLWRGSAGDGDWSNTNNWSTGATLAAARAAATGAGAPATNDDVFIENLRYPITVGMDQSSVDLASLDISMLPGGVIGSAGNSLKIGVSGTGTASLGRDGIMWVRSGEGPIFLNATGASSAPIDLLYHNSSDLTLTGGTATLVLCGAYGSFTVRENGTVGAITTGGTPIVIDAGSGTVGSISVFGGTSTVVGRAITIALVYGGSLVLGQDCTLTTGRVSAFGKLVYGSANTITTLSAYSGAVCEAVEPYPFTVTTSNIYAGASYFKNSPVAITFTTRNTFGFQE